MLDVVRAFMEEDDWPYEDLDTPAEVGTALQTAFKGEHGTWDCITIVREDARQLLFYSLYPEDVPEASRGPMAELVVRANEDLILGNFELDMDDGTMRFKTSLDVSQDELTVGLLRPVMIANVLTMDTYLPAIVAVADGSSSPKDAIAIVE